MVNSMDSSGSRVNNMGGKWGGMYHVRSNWGSTHNSGRGKQLSSITNFCHDRRGFGSNGCGHCCGNGCRGWNYMDAHFQRF